MERKDEQQEMIIGELEANTKNYRESISDLADIMMWMVDGSITVDDEMCQKILQSLAKTRGQLMSLIDLISAEKV